MMRASIFLAAVVALLAVDASVQKDGVVCVFPLSDELCWFEQGKLPALGWNSWNTFECDVNETKILTAANQVVNLGLKDAGYE